MSRIASTFYVNLAVSHTGISSTKKLGEGADRDAAPLSFGGSRLRPVTAHRHLSVLLQKDD